MSAANQPKATHGVPGDEGSRRMGISAAGVMNSDFLMMIALENRQRGGRAGWRHIMIEVMTRRTFLYTGAALTGAAKASKGSSNDKINIGMIGTGARAQGLMQPILKLPKEAETTGVVDAYKGRAERPVERTAAPAKTHPN